MADLSKNILEKIQQDAIKPHSKWHFLAKKSFYWAVFGISIVLGGIASSIIIFQLVNADWDIYSRITDGIFRFILLVLPYFWVVLMILFLFISYIDFKRTKSGYKYSSFLVVGISLLLSIFIGAVLYFSGLSEVLERIFFRISPFERIHIMRMEQIWSAPERGLLAGEIINIIDDETMDFKDFREKKWKVDISEAETRGFIELMPTIKIKIIGEKTGEDLFKAKEIRPRIGRGMDKMRLIRDFKKSERKMMPPAF